MNRYIEIDDMRDGYVELVDWVQKNGEEVSPRGFKTWEIEDASFTLKNPLDSLPLGVGRTPKLAIGAGEALLLCGGITDAYWLTQISPTFKRFLNGGDLHGGYGRRVGPQLVPAVKRLLSDTDTRQAIIQIWDPLQDQQTKRDIPCTLGFNFRIRKGKLNMSATMRSNDVFLGAAYDVFMFTQLQATIAKSLDIPMGTYTHHAYSLHLYERNLEQIEGLHSFVPEEAGEDCIRAGLEYADRCYSPDGFGTSYTTSPVANIERAMGRAEALHDGELLVELTESERWYEKVLRPYKRLTSIDNFSS